MLVFRGLIFGGAYIRGGLIFGILRYINCYVFCFELRFCNEGVSVARQNETSDFKTLKSF